VPRFGRAKNPPYLDGRTLRLQSSRIQANRVPVRLVDRRRMKRLLVATLEFVKKKKGSAKGGTNRGQTNSLAYTRRCHLIEFEGIPVQDTCSFGRYGTRRKSRQDGSSHVVGGITEYLSTMRRFWNAVKVSDRQVIRIGY
jgi:hypothetical protein